MTSTRARPDRGVGSAAATITFWNLVSRILGFVRVIATAAALGIAALGDTFQRTNQVPNLLFELLAGGMLFAVLVPTFVTHLQHADGGQMGHLAGAVATRAVVALGAVAAVGLLLAEPLMTVLTAGVEGPGRQAQIDLGVFLLWFVLPQLMFYGVGAVASALLQADRRFVATSIAPAGSSLIVTLTMVAFAAGHDPDRGLALTDGQKVLLGGGTLLATVVMALVPLLAAARAGYPLRPGWAVPSEELTALMRRGAWAAGHVGLNQVLVIVTVVLAGRIEGGVIAYQTAFTFFLLPHALLAHPIFTSLYPRLAATGAAGADLDGFATTLGRGLRTMAALVLPASALLAAVAAPALSLVQLGEFDADGVALVGSTLAAYLTGLAAYSATFLLTRASYALGDARRPTTINFWVTLAAVAAMVAVTTAVEGRGLLVAFGLITAVTGTAGVVALHRRVVALAGREVAVVASLGRSTLAALACGTAAWLVVGFVGWDTVAASATSLGAGSAAGLTAGALVLLIAGTDDVEPLLAMARRLKGRLR